MEKIDFTNPDYEFDDIAEQVFYPIYDVIAQDLLEETGIVSGSMLDVGCGGGHLGFAVMAKSDLTGAVKTAGGLGAQPVLPGGCGLAAL